MLLNRYELDRVGKEFVRLGDFVFRPSEVDWFCLQVGEKTPKGKHPDKTIVCCKGRCAFLDDDGHQIHSFLVQFFKPRDAE